jgi:hypothetical protein
MEIVNIEVEKKETQANGGNNRQRMRLGVHCKIKRQKTLTFQYWRLMSGVMA